MPRQFGEDPRLDAVFRHRRRHRGPGRRVSGPWRGRGNRSAADRTAPRVSLPFFSHQMVFSVCSSQTTNLSLGLRPVWTPVCGAQRAPLHDVAFMIGERMLVERGRGQVPVDRREAGQAELVGAMGAVAQPCFLHGKPPHVGRLNEGAPIHAFRIDARDAASFSPQRPSCRIRIRPSTAPPPVWSSGRRRPTDSRR